MRLHHPFLQIVALLIAAVGFAAGLDDAEQVELKLNEALRLEKYGVGEAISLTKNDRDTFTILQDASEEGASSMGTNRKGRMVPYAMARTVTHRKENGIDVGRFGKAYLAYESGAQVKIYFCDGAIASPGRFLFLIKHTPAPPLPATSLTPPEPMRPIDLSSAKRVEVKAGEPLDLRAHGGGNAAIYLQSNDPQSFTVVIDEERLRFRKPARWEPSPSGVPTTYRKQFGIPAGGAAMAYPVWAAESGLRVLFCDTLDASLNHYVFLLVPPAHQAALAPPEPPVAGPNGGTVEANTPPAPMSKADPAAAGSAPTWSMIGGTLLYGGKELTRNIDAEAARWNLPREVFVEERAWIAKQLRYGAGQEADYEAQLSQRQERRPPGTRAAVARLREAHLKPPNR